MLPGLPQWGMFDAQPAAPKQAATASASNGRIGRFVHMRADLVRKMAIGRADGKAMGRGL